MSGVEEPSSGERNLASVDDLVASQRAGRAGDGPGPDLVHRTIADGDPGELMSLGIGLLGHADPEHRILGSRLVREVRGREDDAVDALLTAFDRETDPDALFWLISAFGFTGSERATDRLLSLLDSPDSSIRYAVSDALSSVEELSEPAREALLRFAGDADSEVRFSAVFELGAWLPRIPEFRPVLIAALDDPVPLIVRTAREALDEPAGPTSEVGPTGRHLPLPGRTTPADRSSEVEPQQWGSMLVEFPSDLEIACTRRFQAPVALVFDVLTRPEHVRRWFAPFRCTMTICSIDLRPGGDYHHVFIDEDGTECSFRGTWLEVEPPTRTVATWLFEGWPDADTVETVQLHEVAGVTTLTMCLAFRDQTGRARMTFDGQADSFDNMENVLRSLHDPGKTGQ